MRETHWNLSWPTDSCYGFTVRSAEAVLPELTEHILASELSDLISAAKGITQQIASRSINSPWLAYWGCSEQLRRFNRWFPPLRDKARLFHRPMIPRLGNVAITSFCEAAAELCTSRVNWLNWQIDYPAGKSIVDTTLEWRATVMVNEAERIYQRWPFEPIDFSELCVGLKLEIAHLATETVPTVNGKAETKQPLPDLTGSQQLVYESLTDEFQPGKDIAEAANIDHSEVRRQLPNLERMGLAEKNQRGKYRRKQ